MDNKCSQYEKLFIFSDEETLKRHLAECEDCNKEQEKMERVSELLGEVKFYYRLKAKRKSKMRRLQAACALFVLLFTSLTFGYVANDADLMDTLRYGDTLSAEELGFPVDSYGLLMVDE